MKLLLHTSLVIVFFLLLSIVVPSKSEDPAYYSCTSNNKTDGNTQFSKTIDESISELVNGTIENGFSTSSILVDDAKNKTRIHGMAHCRGDLPINVCTNCIRNASKVIRDSNNCPNQSDAVIMYDYCMLRYSTKDFIAEVDDSVGLILYNTGKVTNYTDFNKNLNDLMNNITIEALSNNSTAGRLQWLGKGLREILKPLTIYGLVQCTRDLTDLKCNQCLVMAKKNFKKACFNKEGCRVLYSSCYVRYEIYPFFYPVNPNGAAGGGSMASLPSFGNYESVVVGTTDKP